MRLISRGAYLKRSIDILQVELREVNRNLAKQNPPEEGKKTSRVFEKGVEAVIQIRENVKWNQVGLETIKKLYPVSFNQCFKTEYKPDMRELEKASSEFVEHVEQYKTVTEGQPQVRYERWEKGE